MQNPAPSTDHFFKVACCFEAALTLVAIFLGWLTHIDPFANLIFSESAFFQGLALTLPLLLFFFALQELPYTPLKKIRELLLETLGSRLYKRHWTDLLILAVIAGFSEEVLFRGFLQPWLEGIGGLTIGLVFSNLIFALVHAVTPLYALLALLMGLYLGISLDYGPERNLLLPILIHTFYDFIAFLVILRNYRNSL